MRHFSADTGGFTTMMEGAGMTAGINTKPPIGLLRHAHRACDHEDIPIGSIVKSPLGLLARVEAYRGFQNKKGPDRSHRTWLVCRYLQPKNKHFAIVQLLPELVTVVELAGGTA